MNNPPLSRLLSHARRWASAIRILRARASGAEVGVGCQLGRGCDIEVGFARERRGRVVLGPHCVLQQGVVLHPYGGAIVLGEHVFLGPHVVVYGHGGVTIGDHALVAMHCRIVSANHAMPPPETLIRSLPDAAQPTRIGRDVWLGAAVTILAGVTVGDGSIVAAGSIVTRDLPPNSVAMGAPARVVRSRT